MKEQVNVYLHRKSIYAYMDIVTQKRTGVGSFRIAVMGEKWMLMKITASLVSKMTETPNLYIIFRKGKTILDSFLSNCQFDAYLQEMFHTINKVIEVFWRCVQNRPVYRKLLFLTEELNHAGETGALEINKNTRQCICK